MADRRPGSLSGGQRQRVALARGLAGDPALVLLDEPLSALDAAVRRELRQLIRGVIISSGVPAVLVTHDAEEAEELGDVIIAYDHGRVTGTRVVERPVCPEPPAGAAAREHRASVTGLVPHSWLNALGIPPWVWSPLSVSLHAAFEATIVVAVVGCALGFLLAKGRFPGRGAIETVFSLPMALPPTVVGWYLLTANGRAWADPQRRGAPLRPPAHLHLHRDRHRPDRRVVPVLPALLTSRDLRCRPSLRAGRSGHGAVPMAGRRCS